MSKKPYIVIILLIINTIGLSQSPINDAIPSEKPTPLPSQSNDSTFVTFNAIQFDSIFLTAQRPIDTTILHADQYNVLNGKPTLYSTLSNTGLAHKSMRYYHANHIGFDMSLPSYPAFIHNESNMASYRSILPYSEIRYLMGIGNMEQHFYARFGKQFAHGLHISSAFNTYYAPATFINNKAMNNTFWINATYHTKNSRYGISAYWYRNKLEMGENGGIANDENYTSHTESDNMVLPTHLHSASNHIISSGAGFEQFFNLLPNDKKIETMRTETTEAYILYIDTTRLVPPLDTLQAIDGNKIDTLTTFKARNKMKFTLGRICHSFNYQSNKLSFNDQNPSADFYHIIDTSTTFSMTTDTTVVSAFRNTLKWNSLGYQKYKDDIPFYLYASISHGLYKVKLYDYLRDKVLHDRTYNQICVNGGVIINLFRSTCITGHGELVTLGYQVGDFKISGQWKQFIGTDSRNYGFVSFDAEIKRQSASWFEEHYYSNIFKWENDFNAATHLTFNLKYNYKSYCIGIKQTSISNLVYFGYDALPAQFDGMFSIREAYLGFRQSLKRFELEGFACVQKSSNNVVMHLPGLMGRLKVGFSQPVFRKAATLHPSLTVRYFSKYYADAYMPATRTFYLQNEVEIGNFPFIDLALTIKVKKAHIFVVYSNMWVLTGNYNSFTAPHYPTPDNKVFVGINWRLFN